MKSGVGDGKGVRRTEEEVSSCCGRGMGWVGSPVAGGEECMAMRCVCVCPIYVNGVYTQGRRMGVVCAGLCACGGEGAP